MPLRLPDSPPVDPADLRMVLKIFALFGVLTALGTWAAGYVSVPHGWRLASAAAAATLVVAVVGLRRTGRGVTWRGVGSLLAIWGLIVLANLLAEVRLW